MLTEREARDALAALVQAAHGDSAQRATGLAFLSSCGGPDWLRLDDNARGSGWYGPIVGAPTGWGTDELREPTGLVSLVGSMHSNGRIRERALRELAGRPGRPSAAALAVRCLDHVVQIRALSLPALMSRMDVDTIEIALGVLTAARDRLVARSTLDGYTSELMTRSDAATTVSALRASGEPGVRRWAFGVSLDRNMLTAEEIATEAEHNTDQLIRRRCADQLGNVGTPEQLRHMLNSRFADGRLSALSRLSDGGLTDSDLRARLLDTSARVRETAQWRCRTRAIDAASTYRDALTDHAPQRLAAGLAGLGALGGPDDARGVVPFLQHESAAVRAAATQAFASLSADADVLTELAPLLLDASARVANAAAAALARAGAGRVVAEAAWRSEQPWSRRAAWRMERATGSWNRLEADLHAAADADDDLRSYGVTGVRTWLLHSAATVGQGPQREQAARIGELLRQSSLPTDSRHLIAFHAGLPEDAWLPESSSIEPAATSIEAGQRTGLLRGLQRRLGSR